MKMAVVSGLKRWYGTEVTETTNPRPPVVVELPPDGLPHRAPRQDGQPAQPGLQRGLDHVSQLHIIKLSLHVTTATATLTDIVMQCHRCFLLLRDLYLNAGIAEVGKQHLLVHLLYLETHGGRE